MKINSALIWALVTIGLVGTSFLLGSMTGNLKSDEDSESEQKTEEIKILKEKVDQLTEELTSRGIFSYPQANVITRLQDSGATILITLNGNDPVQDLEVSRTLLYDYSDLTKQEASESLLKEETTYLGTLKAHNPAAFDVPKMKEEVVVRLRFDSATDHWNQYIRIKRSSGGELKSFWVITNRDSEVIDKHIDEGFPVDETSHVVLWKNKRLAYPDIEMNSIFRL